MDTLLIAIAFICGLLVRQLNLPPLVGFLAAGFVLQALGQTGGEVLDAVSDIGVTLMLFAIGLKLRIKGLLRPEVWAGTSIHALGTVVFFGAILVGLMFLVGSSDGGSNPWSVVMLAFALSFSSTVFAVKTLEENGEMNALHGRTAIGILIMQDLIAVAFLTFSQGKIPSLWAVALVGGLIIGRPIMGWLISRSGHGELTTLCGLFLAMVLGAEGFHVVGLKADLGALFVGVLVGEHPKAKELGKSLLSLTDLFLVGFFLSIGLEGIPTWKGFALSLVFVAVLPFKTALFFLLLTRFKLRARSAFISALNLSTFSEFGLIVMAVGSGKGWISGEWLVAVALGLSMSFLIAAPANRRAESLYNRLHGFLRRFEREGRHPDDLPVRTVSERIAIFGMGRVGFAAYKYLSDRFPGRVIGFDLDPGKVAEHRAAGRNVVVADATDSDFWQRVQLKEDIDLVVLAMPKHAANRHAAETLRRTGFQGVVAATATFDDEVKELMALGVDSAFNLYNEAGAGFARDVARIFREKTPHLARNLEGSAN
jgi:glutathione-regulated potassium-efflux system ancillary protein KefC